MFDELITFQARQQPYATAIVTPTGRMTFSELDATVNQFARAMLKLNLAPDVIVAVQLANPVTQWIVVLGLARLGLASACGADRAASLRITDQIEGEAHSASFFASNEWIAQASNGSPEPLSVTRPDPACLGRVLLSSGTTGSQKRIGLSWQLIDANIRNAIIAYGPVGRGPWLIEMSIDTVFGYTVGLAAWAAGSAAFMRSGEALPSVLTRFTPSLLGLVPFQLQGLLQQLPARFNPIAMMRAVVVGGLLSPALAQAARLRLTPDIRAVYGASECGAATILDAALLDSQAGAVGYPMPGVTIEVVDDRGQPLPRGELGEVRIKSKRVVGQYMGEPEIAQHAFRAGWFHPGDLGRLRHDGLLLIDGRLDDLMNFGGPKLLPTTIEDALRECPGVVDAAAFAIPTSTGVGRCGLALVCDGSFDRDVMAQTLATRVPWLLSVSLYFIDRIPRNDMGKIERLALVAAAQTLR